MSNKNKSGCYLASVLLLISGISSCKKFVQIAPPTTQTETNNVFSNLSSATAAQTAIYAGMENQAVSYYLSAQFGMLADELTSYSTVTTIAEYYTNTMTSKDIIQPWNEAYNFIYQANAVINGLQNYNSASPAATGQLLGEAEFIRAFWLFNLTECYGAVPVP